MSFGSGVRAKEIQSQKKGGQWQTKVSIWWGTIFTNLWVVMGIFFFVGGVISQTNNPCGAAAISLDENGLVLFWMMIAMIAATIISFLKPSNKLTAKIFIFGWIGYFVFGELTGYMALTNSEYKAICRPVVEWGYALGRSLLIVVMSGLVGRWCLTGNKNEFQA